MLFFLSRKCKSIFFLEDRVKNNVVIFCIVWNKTMQIFDIVSKKYIILV